MESRPWLVSWPVAAGVRAVASLAAVLALGGCHAAPAGPEPTPTRAAVVVQGGAPGEPGRVLDPTEAPSMAAAPHTAADVEFVQGMILHHAQALLLVEMIEGRADDGRLALFGERLAVTQAGEIEIMSDWLTERDEDVPLWQATRWAAALGEQGHEGHAENGVDIGDDLMPGMLTAEELADLAATDGEEFERRWLEGMTRHHAGAIVMVEELYAEGGGQEPEVFRLASHIEADQQVEIRTMADMLADL